MIEDIVKTRKAIIDREAEEKKRKIDIVAEEFNKKKSLLEEYMNKHSISEEEVYNKLNWILCDIHLPISLESTSGGNTIDSLKETLYIKLGYYKIWSKIPSGQIIERASLKLTEEGEKLRNKYFRR